MERDRHWHRRDILLTEVSAIRENHRRMGTRKFYDKLQPFMLEHQIKMGWDALLDLLSANYMLVRKRRRRIRTTQSHHRLRKYTNLAHGFMPTAPNQPWVSDNTYWNINGSYVYIRFITDELWDGMEDGALKGATSVEKVIHAIEMIRCGYKTTRKVKFEKETWKWFTESASVNNFNGLYDGQTYEYINVKLLDDSEVIEIPENLTFQPESNFISEIFRGEAVKFDLGKLVIKDHAQALYNYLKPSDTDFEKQKRQFVDEIVSRFKNKEYTCAKVISILSISSQCLFEYLTVDQRIAL